MARLGNSGNYINAPVFHEIGDGITQNYALNWVPGTVNNLIVRLDGITMAPSVDFTINGNIITFISAPSIGINIDITGLGVRGYFNIPADASVTLQKLSPEVFDSMGGAVGGGSDKVFYENDQIVTMDYTITPGKNAMSAGPITIDALVTIPENSHWIII